MGVYSTLIFDKSHGLPFTDWQSYELNPEEELPVYDVDTDGRIWNESGEPVEFNGDMEIVGGTEYPLLQYVASFVRGRLVQLRPTEAEWRP